MHLLRTGAVMARGRAVPIQATLLVYDSFPDTDGTLIFDHAPNTDGTGLGWTLQDGGNPGSYQTWEIESNAFRVGSFTIYSSVGFDTGANSFITEATNLAAVQGDASDHLSIAVRTINSSNGYWARLSKDGNGNFIIRLFEVISGSSTQVRTTGIIPSAGRPSTLWVADDGATITAGIDRGGAAITYNTTTFNISRSTGLGKSGIGVANPLVDDYQIVTGTTSPGDLR